MSSHGIFRVPDPLNEPVLSYAPGTPEREELRVRLKELESRQLDIPLVIGGEEVRTGETFDAVEPHDRSHVLGTVHKGGAKEVERAIAASADAWEDWSRTPWEERAAVFLRASELLAGPWRQTLNAATMLGQSKTAHQAEIDAACELIDFWRYNVKYLTRIYEEQPTSSPGVWNRLEYRPLEGFVFAVTPFNFTAIGGNLPTSVALMGNTVVWKPASTAAYSAHFLMKLYEEAGLPPGVINMVTGRGEAVSRVALVHRRLAGVHFTGSTATFRHLWQSVAGNLAQYVSYPRLVGETGGKDFVLAHPSADADAVTVALVRGAFEYQGQKCSAASRAYIPKSLWPAVKRSLQEQLPELRVGDVARRDTFMGAVIDGASHGRLARRIEHAREDSQAIIVTGGKTWAEPGWFVEPTVIEVADPRHALMRDELFGPVLTVFVYEDSAWDDTLGLVDSTSDYALTGSVFCTDRFALLQAETALAHAAGNLYINTKPTGAVVGQQPFGGGRGSGTNDKAGSWMNLLRWISPRVIKESYLPQTGWRFTGN